MPTRCNGMHSGSGGLGNALRQVLFRRLSATEKRAKDTSRIPLQREPDDDFLRVALPIGQDTTRCWGKTDKHASAGRFRKCTSNACEEALPRWRNTSPRRSREGKSLSLWQDILIKKKNERKENNNEKTFCSLSGSVGFGRM